VLDERSSLVLEGVRVGYGSTFQLSDVSLSCAPGDVVGLIGPNGSGKSTLLKSIAGVLKPSAGTITLGGLLIHSRASDVAFVPQREEVNWDFPVTALDVVIMGRYRSIGWVRRPGHQDRDAAERALERMGLGGLGARHISQFSGGQQQRIFLARAIVQEPRLILLDEPFTGIDQENREILHQAIREFAATGVITMMATHDLDEVQATCTHVLCLNKRVVAFGPTATTFTEPNLRQTFGGRVAVFA
jgi:ABC-type Mn2+/Zn2+ transport system ATPase subunit